MNKFLKIVLCVMEQFYSFDITFGSTFLNLFGYSLVITLYSTHNKEIGL